MNRDCTTSHPFVPVSNNSKNRLKDKKLEVTNQRIRFIDLALLE